MGHRGHLNYLILQDSIQLRGDFGCSEIDQSRSVGAETSYREDSTQPRVTLIGQKSIKIGLLELKLRMCLSLLPIMLG